MWPSILSYLFKKVFLLCSVLLPKQSRHFLPCVTDMWLKGSFCVLGQKIQLPLSLRDGDTALNVRAATLSVTLSSCKKELYSVNNVHVTVLMIKLCYWSDLRSTTYTPLQSSLNFEKHSENFSWTENCYEANRRRHNSSEGFDSHTGRPNGGIICRTLNMFASFLCSTSWKGSLMMIAHLC